MGDFYGDLEESYNIDGGTYMAMEQINFVHIKNIKFLHCKKFCSQWKLKGGQGESFETERATYIMKNTRNFEKFIIDLQSINLSDRFRRALQRRSDECSTSYAAESIREDCSSYCQFQFLSFWRRNCCFYVQMKIGTQLGNFWKRIPVLSFTFEENKSCIWVLKVTFRLLN